LSFEIAQILWIATGRVNNHGHQSASVFFAEDISRAKAPKALPRFQRFSLRLCAFAREIFLPPMRPQSLVQRWSVDDFIRQHPVDSVAATINASKLIALQNHARNA